MISCVLVRTTRTSSTTERDWRPPASLMGHPMLVEQWQEFRDTFIGEVHPRAIKCGDCGGTRDQIG